MSSDEVKLTFVAEMSQLRAALEKNTNLTKDDVKQMVAAVARGNQQIEAAQRKTGKAGEQAANKTRSAWEKASKGLGELLGIQGLVDQYFDLSEAAEDSGETMGKWGFRGALAAAGIAAAVVGVSVALVETAKRAQETIDRFDELGVKDIITDGQRQSVIDANESITSLSDSIGILSVAVTSFSGGYIERVANQFTDIVLAANQISEAFRTNAVAFNGWGGAAIALIVQPGLAVLQVFNRINQEVTALLGLTSLSETFKTGGQQIEGFQKQLTELAFTFDFSTEAQKDMLDMHTSHIELQKQVTEGTDRLAKAKKTDTAATRESAEAMKSYGSIMKKALSGGRLAVVAAADASEAADKWDAAIEAGIAASTAVELEWQETEEKQREATWAMIENVAGLIGQVMQLADVYNIFQNRAIDAHADAIEGIEGQIRKEKERYKEATGADKDRSKARIQNLKREKKAHEEAQMSAWRAQRAVAITNSIIATALAAITTLAQLGATPWGIAAAAVATGLGIAATVAIATEPPPKFHTGRGPQEMTATIDKQEAVLNRRAVSDLGAGTIDAANRGVLGGGNGGAMQTAIYLNDRILDTLTANGIMRGSQSRLAVAAVARSANYRGGYK